MQISSDRLLRLAGLAAVAGRLCYLAVGGFHPANVAARGASGTSGRPAPRRTERREPTPEPVLRPVKAAA